VKWLLPIWFGDVAPARKGRDLLLVALPWFLADVLTKGLALGFLKDRELSFFSGGLKFLLSINESLFSHGQTPRRLGTTNALAFWVAMSVGLSAVACFPFARARWSLPRKLLLMLAVLLGGAGVGAFLGYRLEWDPYRLVLHAMRAFGSTAVLFLGLRLTRSRYLALALGLALAGNLGNAINVVYYPRGIIDFIYVPRFSPYLGIFNLSDAALEMSKGLILLSPLALVLCRLLARSTPDWERRLEYVNPATPTATPPQPGPG
jgi:lipoprotein signal peptidase